MSQLRQWEYHVAYGMIRKDEETWDYTRWAGESSTYGDWWESFLQFFEEHKEETEEIQIDIYDGTIWLRFFDTKEFFDL